MTFSDSVTAIGGATSELVSDATQGFSLVWASDTVGTQATSNSPPSPAPGDSYAVAAGVDDSLSGVTLVDGSGTIDGVEVNILMIDTTPTVFFDQDVTTLPIGCPAIDVNDGNGVTWLGVLDSDSQQGIFNTPALTGQPYTVAPGPDPSIFGAILVASSGTISGG